MTVAVLGSGAFGMSLAIAMSSVGRKVQLWGRDSVQIADMRKAGKSGPRLPGIDLPDDLELVESIPTDAEAYILAVPMQSLRGFLTENADLFVGRDLIAACKGIDLETNKTAVQIIDDIGAHASVLSGPSFAADIAVGLPTALSLASPDDISGRRLQRLLATETLRLYRTQDRIGVALGGALKNVVALAAGMTIGAQFGESARAALVTRGYAELVRLATNLGADAATLAGLSGFGDLVLSCTSHKSRNFSYGVALGSGGELPDTTTEGIATAKAVANLAQKKGIDMPISCAVSDVLDGELSIPDAMTSLLSRPLKEE